MWEEEQPVAVGDDTPTLREQAAKQGWEADTFNFGRSETPGVEWFNPGIVRRPDGLWLLVRRSEAREGMFYGHNQIAAIKLNGRAPAAGCVLKFPNSKAEEQWEDARGVYWNGQTWITCVNFTWFPDGQWTGAHIALGVFKDMGNGVDITPECWSPLVRRDPVVGTNQGKPGKTHGKHNKNVLFFFLRDTLYCIYKSDPWHVVQFGNSWEDQVSYMHESVTWKYGTIRGGTPPILVGDKFYTFFHSSLPWRGRYRRYYMGALAFEGQPPFKPLMWTQEPILIGSQNEPWVQRKPLVVFPCGALLEDDKWLVTYGINDLKSGFIEIPHQDLLKLLNPAPQIPGLALLSASMSVPEYAPVPFVEESEEDLSGGTSAVGSDQGRCEPNKQNKVPDVPPAQSSPDGVLSNGKIDLKPREGESTEEWKKRLDREEKLRARAAKARAALAAKRAAGIKLGTIKRKRRKKRKTLKSKA